MSAPLVADIERTRGQRGHGARTTKYLTDRSLLSLKVKSMTRLGGPGGPASYCYCQKIAVVMSEKKKEASIDDCPP